MCEVVLWTEGVMLAGSLLEEDARHLIGVDIPKLGERIDHRTGREFPHGFFIILIGTHTSLSHSHHVKLRGAFLCSI